MEGAAVGMSCGLSRVIESDYVLNSPKDMLVRSSGFQIEKILRVTGTGAISANVLQLTGTVRVLNQWAEIMSITTLNNLTNAYASLYDGTLNKNLTADGLTLSGAPVGSWFTKDKVLSQPYSANIADECRILETTEDKRAGRPFTITAKNGSDTFVRFNLTTTDNPVDFIMMIWFEWLPRNGGNLVFL